MRHRYLRDVSTLAFTVEKCIGCGMCADACPHGVFEVEYKKARFIDKNLCMECGACAMNCPTNAISVDSGVGCAYAYIKGWLTSSEPSCDCSGGNECC